MQTLVKPQYITDENGKKLSVILPVDEYERMLEELEDIENVKLYDAAIKDKGESISLDAYLKQRFNK